MLHMVCPNLKVIQINANFFRRLALICSRTPHGVRGLKSDSKSETFIKSHGRTPHGVRGLKFPITGNYPKRCSSRTPHGVRGLKYQN